jgi:hypothetical protein
MLRIDKVEIFPGAESVTVYGDDEMINKYYLVPNIPRFRLNDDGRPAFAFYKYRNPIDRADGTKGGGFAVFDTELVVPDDQQQIVVAKLQDRLNQQFKGSQQIPQVQLGVITWSRGKSSINIEDMSNTFVQKIFNPGTPSLFGRNITAFTVELTDLGSTFFEQALQNKGGFVQVVYDLYTSVKLPPLKVNIWFNASQFYSFAEDFKEEKHSEGAFSTIGRWLFGGDDSSSDTITQSSVEIASQSQWGGVNIDFAFNLPDPKADADLKNKIRDWAQNELKDAIKRMTGDPLKQATDDQKKVPSNATEFHERISEFSFNSFNESMTEQDVIEWHMVPQGMMEPIVDLKGKDGKPLVWVDYATTVDLNDPFFKTIEVPVSVNADFKDGVLDSVIVQCDYNVGKTSASNAFTFKSPDQVEKFKTFIENDVRTYTFSYKVNYLNQSRDFEMKPAPTDAQQLRIDIGDLGIMAIDIEPGNLNFSEVQQAQVVVQYQDSANNVPLLERQFMLDKNTPRASIREVIFAPVQNTYTYNVTYFMPDGKQYTVTGSQSRSPILYVNKPFHSTRTVSIRAVGDLQADITTIFLDLKYTDDKNSYIQTNSIALDKKTPFTDWSFPIIDENAGKVVYSGSIQFGDGSVQMIDATTATTDTLLVGKPHDDSEFLTVKVMANLIDWNKVKLVDVSLHYADAANGVDSRADLTFTSDAKVPQTFSVRLKDKTKKAYEWQASYFMADSGEIDTKLTTSDKLTLVLGVPAAAATGAAGAS